MITFNVGVQLEDSTSPNLSQINSHLSDLVRNLSNPKLEVGDRSQSLDSSSRNSDSGNKMKLKSSELSTQLKEKCTIQESESSDTVGDRSDIKNNWRQRMMERRLSRTKGENTEFSKVDSFGSSECDERSFDSTSSGTRDSSKVTFNCDSSTENSENESQIVSMNPNKGQEQGQKYVKKDKDSKKRRFRRMITRPLRRSQSAGCEKDIPAHALFLQKSTDEDIDTLESRASELSDFNRRLFEEPEPESTGTRRTVHKTCSADAAIMGIDESSTNSAHKKSRNIARNMKKKFQFLRRRNTDTAIGADHTRVHIRPTPDQAQQWSQSFDSLLGDKGGLELFRGFLKSEFSEENIDFWIACQEYKTCEDIQQLPMQSKKIYTDYVAIQAPKEINLDSNTRMQTATNLEHPTRHTFEDAQKRIQALMEKDSYPRFLESELYLKLVNSRTDSKV